MTKRIKLMVVVAVMVLIGTAVGGQLLMATQTNSPTQIPWRLQSESLERSDDAGGSWLFEEGQFFNANDGQALGYYQAVYRTFLSFDAPNAATVEYTFFFSSFNEGEAPSTLHLRGAHSFSSGNQSGSITARGGNVSLNIGDPFSYNGGNNIMVLGL